MQIKIIYIQKKQMSKPIDETKHENNAKDMQNAGNAKVPIRISSSARTKIKKRKKNKI